MYTIEIEKNFFCDTLHPYPKSISCSSQELFVETANTYRDSLKEQYQDHFDFTEIQEDKHLIFTVSPKNIPTKFLIYELCFNIKSQDDIQVFWDYYANEKVKALHADSFSDLISVVYGMLTFSMNKHEKPLLMKIKETAYAHVIELSDCYIFSEHSLAVLLSNKKFIKLHLSDNIYRIYGSKDIDDLCEDIVLDTQKELESPLEKENTDSHARLSFEALDDESTLHLYDFLDHYELDELIELLSEINSMILLLSSSKFSYDEVNLLVHYLSSMAKILNATHESFSLGMNITLLFKSIDDNREKFLEHSADMGQLCSGFSHDISEWLKKLFFEGAPSLHFLDDSIISNAQTIISVLEDTQVDDEALDSVFDF